MSFLFCFLPPLFCDNWPGLFEISSTFSFLLQPLRLDLFLYLVTSIKLLFPPSFNFDQFSFKFRTQTPHTFLFFPTLRRDKGKETRPWDTLLEEEEEKKGGGEFIREKGRKLRGGGGIVDRWFKHGNSGEGSKRSSKWHWMSCLITLFFITLCLCDEVAAFPILLPDTKFADSHDTQVGGRSLTGIST